MFSPRGYEPEERHRVVGRVGSRHRDGLVSRAETRESRVIYHVWYGRILKWIPLFEYLRAGTPSRRKNGRWRYRARNKIISKRIYPYHRPAESKEIERFRTGKEKREREKGRERRRGARQRSINVRIGCAVADL